MVFFPFLLIFFIEFYPSESLRVKLWKLVLGNYWTFWHLAWMDFLRNANKIERFPMMNFAKGGCKRQPKHESQLLLISIGSGCISTETVHFLPHLQMFSSPTTYQTQFGYYSIGSKMHSSRDAAILNWSGSCIMYDGVNKSEESINCLWLASRFKEPIFGGLCLTPWKAGELGIDEGWWSKANEVKAEGTMKLLMVGGKLENGSTCMSSISSWGWISNLKGRDLVLNERWRTFFFGL